MSNGHVTRKVRRLRQVLLDDATRLITFFFVSLVLIEQCGPLDFIIFKGCLEVSQVREYLNDLSVGREHDEVDKPDLTLGYIRRATVIKLSDRELVHHLQVALREELNEE